MKNSLLTLGFTLLEVLLYLGLFGYLIAAGTVGIYALLASSQRNDTRAYLAEEGTFLADKIAYEISEAQSDSAPQPDELVLNGMNGPVIIKAVDGKFFIERNGTPELPFSSETTQVTNVAFITLSSSVAFSFTLQSRSTDGRISSEDFARVAYVSME